MCVGLFVCGGLFCFVFPPLLWSLRDFCHLTLLSSVSNIPLLHSLCGFHVVLFHLHKCCEYNVAHVYREK